ncbi:MAG: glucose-6-phosphate dehydrogenase assembly protein OpcA [Verrucomicrobia bacterium]|nr:glucose-6-phosphate dehydrogenase assembly protein OpcA [Verrucomicrobiota bacterium]
MPEIQDLVRGMPVEVAEVNRSLQVLWEQEGDVLTRASLINFAVYSEAPDALSANTQLMEQVTHEHACRVILLAANPAASKQRVQAWISAHCHGTGAGARQVCSEQIAFLLDRSSPDLIRNILFSHLDSDLPLYLWWQGELSHQVDQQLWSWVDRFFFDSHSWREPVQQLTILRGSVASAGSRCVLCDLNWRRLIYLRLAFAQVFDHPWVAQQIDAIRDLEVTYHPEYWTTAILFICWVACQLGWELEQKGDFECRFRSDKAGAPVFVRLKALPGPWIGHIKLRFDACYLQVDWHGDFLETTLQGESRLRQILPAGGTTLAELVQEELARGGEHRTYLGALKIAEELWQGE